MGQKVLITAAASGIGLEGASEKRDKRCATEMREMRDRRNNP